METIALRLYGKDDLRLERFELPPITRDELLVKVVSDSLCMSSYKAAKQGPDHKRVPADVAQNPTIIGHEFCGEILQVGQNWTGKYTVGQRFALQPALNGTYDAAGYTYPHLGGDATYGIVPRIYLEQDCVVPMAGDAWFHGSLTEPLSCVIGAMHANFHTEKGNYKHKMEIVKGGRMAALAAVGPMGLALLDYAIHREHAPALLVVTDIDDARLKRAAEILTVEEAAKNGVRLVYLNTAQMDDPVAGLMAQSGGAGYDDVFVFAPVPAVIEQGDAILGYDGCLNFFAGPTRADFTAPFNFYNVHYNATHIIGTSGGNTDDMREAMDLAAQGRTNPAILVTHVGGLDAARDATLNLPDLPGGKKLLYTHIRMPLTAIADLEEKGRADPMYAALADICAAHDGLWCREAEQYLLANAPAIDIP